MDTLASSKRVKQVRNWVELPHDVLSIIFTKLGVVEILLGPRRVCSVWRKLSNEPHLYRNIDLRKIYKDHHFYREKDLQNIPYSFCETPDSMERLAEFAVDMSDGQLVEFSIDAFLTSSILRSIMKKSFLLRCFRIACGAYHVQKVLIEMAKKVLQLEELELCYCTFTTNEIEAFGSSCLQLKSFRLNRMGYKGPPPKYCEDQALAIAKNMPELRHLHIFGNLLTDNGLRAILNGCPHLKTLDLRQCFNVLFEGNLKKRCEDANIKLRLPDDSTDDYEFNPHFNTCPGSDDEDYEYECHYGGITESDEEFDEAAYIEAYSL